MSTLAKIFVIFVLVLSVAFFATSATLFMSRSDWRAAYEKLSEEAERSLEEQQEAFEPYKVQLRAAREDVARLAEAEQKLNTSLQTAQQEIAGLKQQISSLETTNQRFATMNAENQKTIQTQTTSIQNLNAANDQLRQQQAQAVAEKDATKTAYTQVALDLEKTQQELSGAQVALNDLQQKVERFETIIAAAKQQGRELPGAMQPEIQGRVVAVSPQDGNVVLSVGKDQKVMPGYKFSVRRGGEYIGKVDVIDVYEDLSGARIVFEKDGAQIREGDVIETFRF